MINMSLDLVMKKTCLIFLLVTVIECQIYMKDMVMNGYQKILAYEQKKEQV